MNEIFLEVKEHHVGRLLGGDLFHFKIPPYQRPYSWTEEQVEKLLSDLFEAYQEGRDFYFLGAIILEATELDSQGRGKYSIIDGQQRLATLLLLFAVLRDVLKETQPEKSREIHENFIYFGGSAIEDRDRQRRMEVYKNNVQLFEIFVYEEGSIQNLCEQYKQLKQEELSWEKIGITLGIRSLDEESNQRLLSALVKIYDFIGHLSSDDQANFLKYLVNNVRLAVIITKGVQEAYLIFRVLNSRGLPLTAADLLKAFNLEAMPEEEQEDYASRWDAIENKVGGFDQFDSFLTILLYSLLLRKLERNVYEEWLNVLERKKSLNLKFFEADEMHAINLERGKNFFEFIDMASEIYMTMLGKQIGDENQALDGRYLVLVDLMNSKISRQLWKVPLLAFWIKFRKHPEFWRGEAMFTLLSLLERRFIADWLLGKRQENTALVLATKINKASSPGEAISNLQEEMSTFMDRQKDYILHNLKSYDVGKRDFGRYILLRLDLQKRFIGRSSHIREIELPYRNWNEISVEHVFPKGKALPEHWLNLIPEDDRNKPRRFVHSLGNLALLSRQLNNKLKQAPFHEKKEAILKEAKVFEINKDFEEYTSWGPKEIRELTDKRVEEIMKYLFGV